MVRLHELLPPTQQGKAALGEVQSGLRERGFLADVRSCSTALRRLATARLARAVNPMRAVRARRRYPGRQDRGEVGHGRGSVAN